MGRTLRVAMLRPCDSESYASRCKRMFTELLALRIGFSPASEVKSEPIAEFVIDDYNVKHGEYPKDLSQYDCFIITGSLNSAYEELDWLDNFVEFLQKLHENRRKILGICFGHQIIGRALGGEVIKSLTGPHYGVREMVLTDAGRKALKTEPSKMSVRLIYTHGDEVSVLPPQARNLGRDANVSHHGMVVGDNILTFQGHPEFLTEPGFEALNAVAEKFENSHPPGWKQEFIDEIRNAPLDDGMLLAKRITEFLSG